MNKRERIEELVKLLNLANFNYYVKCNPTMSDYDFDMQLKELQRLEEEENYVLPYSPTQKVGSDLQTEFKTIERTKIMGSIENCYDMEELRKWLLQFDFNTNHMSWLLEPKYDGLSCSLVYKHDILVSASTRGSGYKGDDITENVKTIKTIPLHLQINDTEVTGDWHYDDIYVPDEIEIRGEILMPKSEFKKLNAERVSQGLSPFANERNCAAGSIKQLDPKVTASRNLMFMPYAVYCDDKVFEDKYLQMQHMMLDVAQIFGFHSPYYWRCGDINTILSFIREFEERFLHEQDFCMDGCVIKIEQLTLQNEIGYTQKVPKWAKAFKFKQESVSTKLLDVEWQMGRTGKLTPVAILDPVEIDGSVISRASLNNMDYINELNLQIGSYVFVEKGGAVIPKVTGVDYEKCLINNIELV